LHALRGEPVGGMAWVGPHRKHSLQRRIEATVDDEDFLAGYSAKRSHVDSPPARLMNLAVSCAAPGVGNVIVISILVWSPHAWKKTEMRNRGGWPSVAP
jgi:hypothetical protein